MFIELIGFYISSTLSNANITQMGFPFTICHNIITFGFETQAVIFLEFINSSIIFSTNTTGHINYLENKS